MATVRYLTHPEVQVDPAVPIPDWSLSAVGRARVAALIATEYLNGTVLVISSAETKALETASPIADALGVAMIRRPAMHENDRSATGFLPGPVFEAVADTFFAHPDDSVRGWETARSAQARIRHEVQSALATAPTGDILFVGHGAVGTLLFCDLAGLAIDRLHDQPAGGGCLFAFNRESGGVLHRWRRIEDLAGFNPG